MLKVIIINILRFSNHVKIQKVITVYFTLLIFLFQNHICSNKTGDIFKNNISFDTQFSLALDTIGQRYGPNSDITSRLDSRLFNQKTWSRLKLSNRPY